MKLLLQDVKFDTKKNESLLYIVEAYLPLKLQQQDWL
uniref:Uncharacterized protein n=1 Tax=Brassica oleracea TaxID=3712 RepID=A0A3P6F5B0_BRAOL|nr:unnamed protein product [Brassica oleracea]